MTLTAFIKGLTSEGVVEISSIPREPSAQELDMTSSLLSHYHQFDSVEMPFRAPDFSPTAAIWAANYCYQALQLTLIRELDEEAMRQKLKPFTGQYTPETIYSADLVLRHLPTLLDLAKGLSPADILVKYLHEAAVLWPFSSVGLDLPAKPDISIVLSNPSLRQTYIDRIIKRKDRNRIDSPAMEALLRETTGSHLSVFWPEIENEITTTIK